MRKDEELRSHFPLKRCLIATLVIILCAVMVLTLLYSIINTQNLKEKSWIFILVWGAVFGGMTIFYWIEQTIKYIKKRKDEK